MGTADSVVLGGRRERRAKPIFIWGFQMPRVGSSNHGGDNFDLAKIFVNFIASERRQHIDNIGTENIVFGVGLAMLALRITWLS